ncbi:hypothetical protein [Microbacterium sp.]|uniref:hypothetical protein n=1 Tax=Microbacterium sp. TaxID=51671 RepID=UPI0039E216EB
MTDHEPPDDGLPGDEALDDAIVDGLRRIFGRIDPMPPVMDDAVMLALSTVDLDAELAALVVDAREGVRGDGRVLRFAAEGVTLVLSVVPRAAGTVRLDGWITPAQDATVTVRHSRGTAFETDSGPAGRFALDGIPTGSARVLVVLGDGRRIATPALRL